MNRSINIKKRKLKRFNHKFKYIKSTNEILLDKIDNNDIYYIFKCIKCNAFLIWCMSDCEFNNKQPYYNISINSDINSIAYSGSECYLTCEEIIIKQILE